MPKIDSWDNATYMIGCVNMADGGMNSFVADGKWFVRHGTPGAYLGPFPLDGGAPISLREAFFLGNCIAFDHDMPTVVRPAAHTPAAAASPIEPLKPPPSGQPSGLWYYDSVGQALSAAADIRVGDPVQLRYEYNDSDNTPDLRAFSSRFGARPEPLAMYAMATRQIDVFSEYIALYRILEFPQKNNGKKFIEDNLDLIETYNFGTLLTSDDFSQGIDVFKAYCARALGRVAHLRGDGLDNRAIAARLYAIRNGLAHGKDDMIVDDSGAVLSDVGADVAIVRMLARMVVEPK